MAFAVVCALVLFVLADFMVGWLLFSVWLRCASVCVSSLGAGWSIWYQFACLYICVLVLWVGVGCFGGRAIVFRYFVFPTRVRIVLALREKLMDSCVASKLTLFLNESAGLSRFVGPALHWRLWFMCSPMCSKRCLTWVPDIYVSNRKARSAYGPRWTTVCAVCMLLLQWTVYPKSCNLNPEIDGECLENSIWSILTRCLILKERWWWFTNVWWPLCDFDNPSSRAVSYASRQS